MNGVVEKPLNDENNAIKFLYENPVGRFFLKLLVNPGLSKASAHIMSSRISARFVPSFIRKNAIDISKYVVPKDGYESFNAFFTRRLIDEYVPETTRGMVSPCDGLLTVSPINEVSIFKIKHTCYDLSALLQDEALAKEYIGGTALIYRLTPSHYHRYIYCTSGRITCTRRISGILHSVQPVCHEKYKVFVENSREYVEISQDEAEGNKVIQMEVGALLVGKISNHELSVGDRVKLGYEKGYFEYGGSSIVVLTKRRIEIPENISCRVPNGYEIPVSVGEFIYD